MCFQFQRFFFSLFLILYKHVFQAVFL
uniref:Uncharacterized protein n=1 Tax=Rhizophora mucronata TaxID=61149 RepID=A0A2P2NUY5_RHIMU